MVQERILDRSARKLYGFHILKNMHLQTRLVMCGVHTRARTRTHFFSHKKAAKKLSVPTIFFFNVSNLFIRIFVCACVCVCARMYVCVCARVCLVS